MFLTLNQFIFQTKQPKQNDEGKDIKFHNTCKDNKQINYNLREMKQLI